MIIRYVFFVTFTCLMMMACESYRVEESESIPDSLPAERMTSHLYVGTYTRTEGHVDGKAEGIYRLDVDAKTGGLSNHTLAASLINPSFIQVTRDKKYLYAVSELAHDDEPTGFIHAFAIQEDGLTPLQTLPTHGQAPCHIGLDQKGSCLLVSNYVGGVATVYRIGSDGHLTETDRFTVPVDDKESWLHSATVSPDNSLVAIADKGRDRIWLFDLDADKATIEPHSQAFIPIASGSGPRHAVWSDTGDYLYVINELSNTVSVISQEATEGPFKVIQTESTLPREFTEESYGADIHLHPGGQYLYASNRGHNSLAIYTVDKQTGIINPLGHQPVGGEYPRNFAISSNGKLVYVANQNTDNINRFRIHPSTGMLSAQDSSFHIPTPVCLEFTD